MLTKLIKILDEKMTNLTTLEGISQAVIFTPKELRGWIVPNKFFDPLQISLFLFVEEKFFSKLTLKNEMIYYWDFSHEKNYFVKVNLENKYKIEMSFTSDSNDGKMIISKEKFWDLIPECS